MTMSKDLASDCDSKIRENHCQDYEDSDDENIDVGSNYNESSSDNEVDIELTRDEAVVIKKAGVRSFGIDDILNHTNNKAKDVTEPRHKISDGRSPLDALFSLTTSFESMKQKSDKLQLRKEVCSKKKRKSRTAFTNHQIFELEKRFLYQKYLSPADRDEISSTLGLSGGQVITWFQNRRAKFKRDLEEMKKDVEKGGGGRAVTSPQQSQHSPSPQQILQDNISRLHHPPAPLPLHNIHRPHLPPLPHPFPLLALAPHLMYPFQRPPLSPPSRSRSSSPPSSHGRLAVSPQIKVEKTSP